MNTYNFSTDYEALWVLIFQGHKFAGWISTEIHGKSDEVQGKIYEQVVEIRKSVFNDTYRLGYPGAGFGWEGNDKAEFIETCKKYKLKYIVPAIPTDANFFNKAIERSKSIDKKYDKVSFCYGYVAGCEDTSK